MMIHSKRVSGLAAALVTVSAAPVRGQLPLARYQPQPDTVWTERIHLQFAYGIVNGDTVDLGEFNSHALEGAVSRPGTPLISEVVRYQLIDPYTDTTRYEHDARGRILAEDGVRLAAARSTFYLPLPDDGRLEPGREWTDTVHHDNTASRLGRYRVARVDAGGGTPLAVVEGVVDEEYRYAWPWRERAGRLDVRGPATATYAFDLAAGRMTTAEEVRDIPGTFRYADRDGDTITIPAGVRARTDVREVEPGRVARLRRMRSGPDAYSYFSSGGGGRRHRWTRLGDTLESDFLQMGPEPSRVLTRTVYRGGRVLRQEWERTTWAGTRVERVAAAGSAGPGETTLVPPARFAAWAVADEGMEEHLVRVLVRLPRNRTHAVAIFRPGTGTWDRVRVRVETFMEGKCIVITGVNGAVRQLIGTGHAEDFVYSATMEGERMRIRGPNDYVAELAAEHFIGEAAVTGRRRD